MPDADLYRDRWITCTDAQVVIRGYHFPFGLHKRIPYDDIRRVTKRDMDPLTGKGRLWGTASPRYWAHLDLRRPRKSTALVLDVGGYVRPFITPDDPDRVLAIIESHRSHS